MDEILLSSFSIETKIISAVACAYLLGSISSALLIAKIMRLPDPRLSGSNNAGATNMNRLYGKKPAVLTLFFDCLKGLVAVGIANFLSLGLSWQIGVGLVVVVGHIYPIFFGFKGGKGVATFLGVLLGFYPLSFLIFAISWLVIAKGFKISSLSALTASLINLACYWFIFDFNQLINLIISFITVLIFFTHKKNLAQIFSGKEGKIND